MNALIAAVVLACAPLPPCLPHHTIPKGHGICQTREHGQRLICVHGYIKPVQCNVAHAPVRCGEK
jgi:hypothetical protein